MTGLSVALCWLPVIGSFIAGFVGGRKLQCPYRAAYTALVPAALWLGVFIILSQKTFNVGRPVQIGELAMLGPVTALAIIGGALVGAEGQKATLIGAVLTLAGLVWFIPQAAQIVAIFKTVQETQVRYEPDKNKTCPENLRGLYNAVMIYAESWDQTLPPADRWLTAIKDNVQQDEWLHCPEVSKSGEDKYGYAMNAALGGKRLDAISDKAKTVLFYDSTNAGINAHDNMESLPKPGRHTGRNNIVYLDGRVESVEAR